MVSTKGKQHKEGENKMGRYVSFDRQDRIDRHIARLVKKYGHEAEPTLWFIENVNKDPYNEEKYFDTAFNYGIYWD
jgi:hypothetical protein